MAHEWYVQQGGKQYGPLTSAHLKKLATDGKIAPATSVRLGSEGAWVPASRVQGLFAATPPAASSEKVVAPPVAPPPPMANPLARVPMGQLAPRPKVVAAGGGAMTAKIVGAVALILGVLALATCWLPVILPAGGGALGWTGIVGGGLGLLLAIGGLVLAAMHQGSGLYLNIAAGGSSVVGLVFSLVLGSLFGLFGSSPQPVAIVPQPLPPVQAAPAPQASPPQVPEPELEPELVWTDASQPIQQGNIQARIASVKIESLRLESTDPSKLKRQNPQPMLKVRVMIENTSTDKIVEFLDWTGSGGLIPQELEAAVSSALGGQASSLASATASLVDDAGNLYKQTPALMLSGVKFTVGEDHAVRPGKTVASELVFPPPLETIEFLRLELSPSAFGGTEPLRFQIPKEMITGP